ncbi:hypothetical protein HCN44_009344 [Aphidius gifuensis]|uniref:Bcl-2 Bcl-2 homology region 1-3 domain-containing protein n=1 Tax=Aphidius gifuensis TaxID=684658 RepID=A0A834Y3L1_APHGI|nr:uncharacterized protein LOC122860020 [Aphidius gifuensis]KAF7997946.1 hypothetical protein HCN44_009344 [Aphidius gifuensis]
MAGDSTRNNEIGGDDDQGASARGEPHSRVGGILECDPPGNRNLLNSEQPTTEITDGVCRYGASGTSSGMSFIEICQIRLQHLFPQLAPPSRYAISDDSVEMTAECLANDVIRYLLKEDMYLISRDPTSRSMRHNVYQMLNKHSILFTSMVNRLNVVPDTAYESFTGVADELFLHGGITWARIVCLYAFMGRLALWARDGKMNALKKKLPHYVSRYISEEIAHFIKGYGGWEQLCIEYPVDEEVSGAVWRSLLMTGATLSLVATILTVTS